MRAAKDTAGRILVTVLAIPVERVREMRAAGHGPTTIDKALGISRMSVHRALTHPAVHTSVLWGASFWDTTDARFTVLDGTLTKLEHYPDCFRGLPCSSLSSSPLRSHSVAQPWYPQPRFRPADRW